MTGEALPAHLFVFMTEGMSLAAWRDLGMLKREMAVYEALRPALAGVTIVSYGGSEDHGVIADYPNIDVVSNTWNLSPRHYRKVLPWLLWLRRRGPAVYKTNQMQGAKLARKMARKNVVPLIARCGYMLSEFVERAEGRASPRYVNARELEQLIFSQASHCVVTTEGMRDTVLGYGVPASQVSVVPNYVDTDLFTPAEEAGRRATRHARRLIFIGRLHDQKNPLELVRAAAGLNVEIEMVGQGPLEDEIKAEAARLEVPVILRGALPHSELPAVINGGTCYVLPSHYEGHPKTLLEAMSCGAAVIGSDRPGIREVIRHDETGLLCEPDAASLCDSIRALLSAPERRARLGQAARQQILSEVSLEQIKQRELAVYRNCLEQG